VNITKPIFFAVVGHCLVYRWPQVRAEILVDSAVILLAVAVEGVAARHLGMGVDVYRNQVFMWPPDV